MINFYKTKLIKNVNYKKFNSYLFKWGLGIGDWGLGDGDWAQSPIPNPQSPIPNPHKIILNKALFYSILNFIQFSK